MGTPSFCRIFSTCRFTVCRLIPRIVAIAESGYKISSGNPEVTILVDGPAPGKPDDWITLTGTFRSDGPRLVAERVRVLPA